MPNLREVILTNIAKAQAEVDKYKADLAALEAEGGNWLERDLKELQVWVQSLASHLFSPAAQVAVAAQPAVPVMTIVPSSPAPVELPDVLSTASAAEANAGQAAANDTQTPPVAPVA